MPCCYAFSFFVNNPKLWTTFASIQMMNNIYSGTPPSGHPWNAAIYDNADTSLSPECYLHKLTYNQNPWSADTSLFRKVDTWLCPNRITAHTNSPL